MRAVVAEKAPRVVPKPVPDPPVAEEAVFVPPAGEMAVEIPLPPIDAQPPANDPLGGLPGPERFTQPRIERERIRCRLGCKALVVPERSTALYERDGWVFAYHTAAKRSTSGIVEDELKYQTDPGGRLMRSGSYVMIMRPDTHEQLLARDKQQAEGPLQQLLRNQHGREGRDPDFFAVTYRVEDGVRPMGAAGALVRDDD